VGRIWAAGCPASAISATAFCVCDGWPKRPPMSLALPIFSRLLDSIAKDTISACQQSVGLLHLELCSLSGHCFGVSLPTQPESSAHAHSVCAQFATAGTFKCLTAMAVSQQQQQTCEPTLCCHCTYGGRRKNIPPQPAFFCAPQTSTLTGLSSLVPHQSPRTQLFHYLQKA